MVERLDHGVGAILQALDGRKLADDTLVIFTSDNGGTRMARNAPFSGAKSTTFEGGIRVPCIARWPGRLPPGTASDQAAITMDLTASIVRLAGAEPPNDRPFDGLDVLRLAEAKEKPVPRTLFWRFRRSENTWKAVRDGSLKYVSHRDGDKEQEYLFDLERDPGEKEDLLARRKEDGARLKELLSSWEREVRANR
jgi:N-acetylgalactosamine-6-sulfatase